MNLTRRLARLLSKGRGGRRNGRHQWHPARLRRRDRIGGKVAAPQNPLDDYGPPQVGSPVSAIVVGSPFLVSFNPKGNHTMAVPVKNGPKPHTSVDST